MVAGAEGSRGAEWLHEHHRLCGDVYVNQGEECNKVIGVTHSLASTCRTWRSKIPFHCFDLLIYYKEIIVVE